MDDDIPEVAARFIGRHKLSKTLLPNVEKELHVTQCELFRRSVVGVTAGADVSFLHWAPSHVTFFVAIVLVAPPYPITLVHHLLPKRLRRNAVDLEDEIDELAAR